MKTLIIIILLLSSKVLNAETILCTSLWMHYPDKPEDKTITIHTLKRVNDKFEHIYENRGNVSTKINMSDLTIYEETNEFLILGDADTSTQGFLVFLITFVENKIFYTLEYLTIDEDYSLETSMINPTEQGECNKIE
ncbi:hypothetical protein OA527_02675 [Pelagibacteraceae bacterium]|nr:hypothetical protein [Pelagibacteraceae bacterium]